LIRREWRHPDPDRAPELLAAAALVLRSRRIAQRPPAPPVPDAELERARAVGASARARGGGGTTLPGKELLTRMPDALRRLASRLRGGSVLVSGTNGKTTTAAMIASILREAGVAVVHNRAGANMHWGVATALLEQEGEVGILEVDEAWLPLVAVELEPRAIVLGNLFRDRPDGYGERDAVADAWTAMAGWASTRSGTTLVLNADDPTVARIATAAGYAGCVRYFGIEDTGAAEQRHEHARDATHCRSCGAGLLFERAFLSHLGHYRCPRCGAARPAPDVGAERVSLHGLDGVSARIALDGRELDVRVSMPGLYNVYNALAATAAAAVLGAGDEAIRRGLAVVRPAFGRSERIPTPRGELVVFLMKNPAGANELLRVLAQEAKRDKLDLWLALNDDFADGRDVSWIWDVDFEVIASRVRRLTCSGSRAAELALRLKYAGWPTGATRVEEAIGPSLDRALDEVPSRLFALPTYSALIELRMLLTDRCLAPPYWE
jgi:lipid II isoglutaminyl synthase (glutamine-hydrolysing)